MRDLWLVILLAILIAFPVYANEIGFTISQLHEEIDWGGTANLSGTLAGLDAELDIQAQSGDLIRGRYRGEVGLANFKVFQDGTFKGYTLDSLGRQSDIGIKGEVGVGGLNVAVGIFGRNAGEFGPPNAYGTLRDLGYDEATLEAIGGLDTLNPAPTGLSIRGGNSLNLLLSTEFEVADLDVELRVLPQLTGEVKAHQALLLLQTDYQLTDNLKLNLGADIATQLVEDTIEYETATVATVSLEF